MAYFIRRGTPADLPAAFDLIMELAVYEKAPEQVTNTPELMLRDGFGPQPAFGFFVAEAPEGSVVALALYFTRYSTWKGRRLYLEDLIVTDSHRRQGLGKLLLDAVVREALEQDMSGVVWQALDWNTPALDFYRKLGAEFDNEWVNCSLSRATIEAWQYGL
ncbi:MAG: GNAT family N-acetyltransferase [Bernardetiaceae bacterium]|jgi:GNAT superfamily N-acetyltransferase|nr:GNAT family N-acetyltransferase [Bernardetiaceae bacterium]